MLRAGLVMDTIVPLIVIRRRLFSSPIRAEVFKVGVEGIFSDFSYTLLMNPGLFCVCGYSRALSRAELQTLFLSNPLTRVHDRIWLCVHEVDLYRKRQQKETMIEAV